MRDESDISTLYSGDRNHLQEKSIHFFLFLSNVKERTATIEIYSREVNYSDFVCNLFSYLVENNFYKKNRLIIFYKEDLNFLPGDFSLCENRNMQAQMIPCLSAE